MAGGQQHEHESTDLFPAFLAAWIQLLVPQPCYDTYFVDFDFLGIPCLKVVISKGLGYSIILGSCIVKLPQIIKLLKSKSAVGISMLSVTCELIAISASWSYGFAKQFPFSAYGEAMFLAFQTVVIACLVQVYSGKTIKALAIVVCYVSAMMYFLSPYVPFQVLSVLQTSNVFVIASSKLIQAYANFRNKSTGQLSAITISMIFLGSVGRIFTSVQETGDTLVVFTYVVSSICNFVIVCQLFTYWHNAMATKRHAD